MDGPTCRTPVASTCLPRSRTVANRRRRRHGSVDEVSGGFAQFIEQRVPGFCVFGSKLAGCLDVFPGANAVAGDGERRAGKYQNWQAAREARANPSRRSRICW